MSDRNLTLPTFGSLINRDVLSRAFIVALVLGSILTLINQSNALFGGAAVQVLPLVLVYLTPFAIDVFFDDETYETEEKESK